MRFFQNIHILFSLKEVQNSYSCINKMIFLFLTNNILGEKLYYFFLLETFERGNGTQNFGVG